MILCSDTQSFTDTKVAFIKSKRAATYRSLIPEINTELQTFSPRDWLHMRYSFHLTLWAPSTPRLCSNESQNRKERNADMYTWCPHVKFIHTWRHGDISISSWCLRHDALCTCAWHANLCLSQPRAPAGKLAKFEVRAEVALRVSDCRWDYFLLSFFNLHY